MGKNDARSVFVSEIERFETAVRNTKSPYLANDYRKAVRRMRKELAEYDAYKEQYRKCSGGEHTAI